MILKSWRDRLRKVSPHPEVNLTMVNSVSVVIHPSQFPAAVSEQLRESLRTRMMNHKFHYDTPRQASAWLRVHDSYSPARRDEGCEEMYASGFAQVAKRMAVLGDLDVVSLGSGGGRKDATLVRALHARNPDVHYRYIPVDVSPGLSILSRAAVVEAGMSAQRCAPVVMDLEAEPDWEEALRGVTRAAVPRVVCFFGMLPNCDSGRVFPRLASILGDADVLLMSANLAPGSSYRRGVERVQPQYDNPLTREWLLASLFNVGVDPDDGSLSFAIREWPLGSGLLRIEGEFTFEKDRHLDCEGEAFSFASGERFRLFFSYRHTPKIVDQLCRQHGMRVMDSWVSVSEDEGLFLVEPCRKECE